MSDNISVKIESLCGGYEEKDVIRDLSLNVEKGSLLAIAGPNGAGKSTLLKHLIREIPAKNGKIYLDCRDISAMKQKEIASLISFMGQDTPRENAFTVREAVALGSFAAGGTDPFSVSVDRALHLTGTTHLADKLITRISGGEFQLVMLARTICQNTDIIALDEPVNNLDPRHQIMLMDLLSKLAEEGRTIICVLHDLNAILRNFSSCLLMENGSIFAYGRTQEVLTEENMRRLYGIDAKIITEEGKSVIMFR